MSKNEKKLNLLTFEATSKYKSIGRAIKRGLVSSYGILIPKRPFNNRGNSSIRTRVHSRATNETKKQIYGEIRKYIQRSLGQVEAPLV